MSNTPAPAVVCDTVTDNTAVIQMAINAAAERDAAYARGFKDAIERAAEAAADLAAEIECGYVIEPAIRALKLGEG